MNTVETSALTRYYDETLAVDSLDLTISEGEIYAFLGPNGAGKTTTMRMLTALLPPTTGQAWIDGVSIFDHDAVRSHIGFLPESPPLYAELSAREQLLLAADLHDMASEAAAERIDSLLGRFQWHDVADESMTDYSTGMRQATAFVQAILHEPAVVFLDEPTSGLDPRAVRTVREIITNLAANGMTIFLSTHILSVVEELADTVGVLSEGRLVAEDSPAELKRHAGADDGATLEDVFLELTTGDTAIRSEEANG